MTEPILDLGLRTTLSLPYEQAVERLVGALKDHGFGVLTEIDVKATLKKKLDADFRKYVILGACNPPLAHQALTTNLEIGLLLPCNAIVYETDDGGSAVSIIDPMSMVSMVDSPGLAEVAQQARARLERVIESIQSPA
jgi:uncharacterized protein (DUF302 family)